MPHSLRSPLLELLKKLGSQLLQWRREHGVQGVWEGSEFKAVADRQAHDFLCAGLRAIDASIPIVSEEDELSHHAGDRPQTYWLIDPIDGTASYAENFDGFVTQIALIDGGRPQVAAVRVPAFDHSYFAERGGGAELNGQRLRLAFNPSNPRTLIDNHPSPRNPAARIFQLLKFDRYIECGSIGLKACKVADGTADLFFKDVVVRDWDVAPADLIVSEAGGVLCSEDGGEFLYTGSFEKPGVVVASNDVFVKELIACLKNDDRGVEFGT